MNKRINIIILFFVTIGFSIFIYKIELMQNTFFVVAYIVIAIILFVSKIYYNKKDKIQ